MLTPCFRESDPSPFSLSAEQQAIFVGWRRPAEISQPASGGGDLAVDPPEIDLAQDLATDCSVVASLCAAVRHFRPTEGSVSSRTRTFGQTGRKLTSYGGSCCHL